MCEDFIDGIFEGNGKLLARHGENMLGREDAENEIPGIGELEHLLDIEDEMVEPAFAHQAGGKQQLAAGAPQVGDSKTGDLRSEAELQRCARGSFVVIERPAEL